MESDACHSPVVGGSLGCRSSRINRFCSKKERAVKAETGELGWGRGSVWEATNLVGHVRKMARGTARAQRQLGSDWKAQL